MRISIADDLAPRAANANPAAATTRCKIESSREKSAGKDVKRAMDGKKKGQAETRQERKGRKREESEAEHHHRPLRTQLYTSTWAKSGIYNRGLSQAGLFVPNRSVGPLKFESIA
jgi:hypothetical protein